MDPDICRKQPYLPMAADVWACGVILYTLFTGKFPFDGEFEQDLYRKIQQAKFHQVPQELGCQKIRSLFTSIFQADSSKRITAEELLEHPWVKDV